MSRRRALRGPYDVVIAGLAFVAIFFFAVPFPLVIAAAALAGFAVHSAKPAQQPAPPPAAAVPLAQTLKTAALWLAIWIVPLLLVDGHRSAAPMSRPTSPCSSRSSPS